MNTQKIRTIYTFSLFVLDITMIVLAFATAYWLRANLAWPDELVIVYPATSYFGFLLIQILTIVIFLSYYRQYYIPRSVSRVDQVYYIIASVVLGSLVALGVATLFFKDNDAISNYPRAMIVYDAILAIIYIVAGRMIHHSIRLRLRDRGLGQDRLLVVGTGHTAEFLLQRIIWSPQLGYELVGVIDGDSGETAFLGVPILGTPEDLPRLIENLAIDEVIVAIPEKGHREAVRVISYCERGRVSVKVFPDIFEFVTTQATIDDLGGLPLLSVRDFALRGYLLIFKRIIDVVGSLIALILLSPIMMFTALAIKLESPGPVFFVQSRMSLDGRRFMMIKFRSMRNDAEKEGPGWTTDDDPRQTKLGSILRRFELDEIPNLFNVLLGEMSLVGPRPEQAHYVNQFRRIVPRYMERHREKGGMTGWAQINGLRGDTSIVERTKYDLWYSENWSILLDTKILLRTFWQIVRPREKPKTVLEASRTELAEQAKPGQVQNDLPAEEPVSIN